MDKIGAKLKKIRLEKGISLEEVNKKTKIHLHILRAIEDDSFASLNPVYLKGFLNIYCKFLGVNPADFIPSYKEPQVVVKAADNDEKTTTVFKKQPPEKKKVKININFKPFIMLLSVIIALFLLLNIFKAIAGFMKEHPIKIPKKTHKEKVVVAKKEQPRNEFNKNKSENHSKKDTKEKEARDREIKETLNSISSSSTKELKETKEAKETKELKESKELKENKETVVPVLSGVTLGIHAKDDCWVQIKLDGKVAFQNVLAKGRLESWNAKEKIELSLGSAGSVEVEINNNRIPPLGRKGQSLKNILITKDGLKLRR